MASFIDNFYIMDPYAPPSPGTALTRYDFVVNDRNNDNLVGAGRDTIDGVRIRAAYPGDTVTVQFPDGTTDTIVGVTFYLRDGREVFSPIDGKTLHDATFVSSSWVYTNVAVTPAQMQLTCFTPGTRIRTPEGGRPVEALAIGDLVTTLDNGPQPIRWIGRRVVEGRGEFAPIRFRKGAVGNRRDLRVSPQHRMLVTGWQAELLFDEPEILVAAQHLANGDTIHAEPCDEIEYIHLMFDRHEVIFAEGVPTESFHPGDYVMAQDRALMAELTTLFPELKTAPEWTTARRVIKGYEAALIAA